jgi:putative DNA primase/helicase
VPTLLAVKGNTLCETNPMADWLDHWVVCDKEAKTYIGDQEMEVSKYLYPNYIRYCKATRTSSVSLKKFSGLLVDLCKNQLGLDSVEKARDRVGSHILGLRLRTENDKNLPSPVTGHIFPDESVTASDGKVMAETPAIINVMDVMD